MEIKHFPMVRDKTEKIESVTFTKVWDTKSPSVTSTLGELIDEINHYQAFYLTNVGEYTNKNRTVFIKPDKEKLTPEIVYYISLKMKG